MAVSKHQFQLLSEMGIALWQPRTAETSARPLPEKESKENAAEKSGNKFADKAALPAKKDQQKSTPPNFDALMAQPLFHDILLSIGLSVGEVTATEEQLDLGLLHWQFSPEQELALSDKVLTTPPIQVLAASGTLKRQLWQLLQEHSL
ncbi:DNA polymerase III subunit psi [Thalassomonas actiniarum]|uniref:DNA polymerase III subunit psi n=1 Tax=Thalassomonas actiniarum TaxID=485447 RepID=A0AAF0C4I9_9GAMM|nr:DNA polymerase III subunit psi [Thalassomonas actiniarum]WDE00076.1 DNA polymerase III subunit psi [Thalassomonas actiniarum]